MAICFTRSVMSADNKKLNLNTATLEQLVKIPGMSKSLANKILKYRTNNDGFTAVEELFELLDEKQFEQIKKYIEVRKKEGCDC